MDKCTKYINLFLFSLFQSCTQHFYHGRQYGNHNNGHNQQFEVLLYKRKVTEEITRITEDGNPAGAPNQVVVRLAGKRGVLPVEERRSADGIYEMDTTKLQTGSAR